MNQNFSKEEILNILKSTRHFKQFEDRQLSQLITNSLVEEFPKGNTIIQEGLKNNRFFVLLEGTVAVYAGNEFISSMRRQGDIFGEMSVITKGITTASIVAQTDVIVFTVPARDIFDSNKVEIRAMVYKILLDILTGKLALTTNRVKGFQATAEELNVKKLELAETEDDLVKKEIILQSVLESMSDGVVVTDNKGNLLHLNKAFCELTGLQSIPDDFDKWPHELGLFHTDEKTQYSLAELPMMKVLKGEKVDSEEILLKNSFLKEPIWLQASSRLLEVDNSQKNHGAVTVFRDYTKKKKEEQALIKAKETAEAMSKAKSDFLAVMSHELRTPLNGIMGMTDLIRATDLNTEQQDFMDTIRASSENLLTLVKNILDYNTIDSGALKVENQLVSIKECFAEILNVYSSHANKKGIVLKSSVSPDIPENIEGYEKGLKQVLRNLADNAIKFSESGTITLSASLKSMDEKTADVLISVKDTGIGIASESIPDLFKPFTQADSTYARQYEGVGIGLSICEKFVELMRGDITVKSELKVGSEFIIQIPFILPTTASTDPPASISSETKEDVKMDQDFASHYPRRILVVEDNAMNQKLIMKVLEKLGYSPKLAINGLEAVEMTRKESFEIILMDLQMPEMDGVEATKVICEELPVERQPTIIALTANVAGDVKQTCFNAGMKDYMSKPLKLDKIAAMLRKWS